jgi:hypothetical protein
MGQHDDEWDWCNHSHSNGNRNVDFQHNENAFTTYLEQLGNVDVDWNRYVHDEYWSRL